MLADRRRALAQPRTSQLPSRVAVRAPAAPRRPASSGSESTETSAWARRTGSSGGTTRPEPSETSSGKPPTSVATKGRPRSLGERANATLTRLSVGKRDSARRFDQARHLGVGDMAGTNGDPRIAERGMSFDLPRPGDGQRGRGQLPPYSLHRVEQHVEALVVGDAAEEEEGGASGSGAKAPGSMPCGIVTIGARGSYSSISSSRRASAWTKINPAPRTSARSDRTALHEVLSPG